MKLTRLVSAISAVAMSLSMVTVANAASLGGNPTVKATFDTYEKVSDAVAFAYVNVTIDVTEAEDLSAYELVLDEITWEEVATGNGITTAGVAYTAPTGFVFTKAKSTIPTDWTVNDKAAAFGPMSDASKYLVNETTTIRLALRVNNFDSKGNFAITDATVDGKSTTDNAVWAYAKSSGTVTVAGCDIPSYNEWSNPVVEEEKTVWTSADDASIPADKQIIADVANVTGITKDTRVTVSNGSEEKTFGNNIFAFLRESGLEIADDATVDAEIRFAILAPIDADADAFTFSVN